MGAGGREACFVPSGTLSLRATEGRKEAHCGMDCEAAPGTGVRGRVARTPRA